MAKKKKTSSAKPTEGKPRVHKDLDGFDIKINSFGEITTSYDMDRINEFLNKNVDDKKLRDREDIPGRDAKPEEDEDLDTDAFLDEEE
ncbi:hypothetical protein [Dyadobacter tibetensis]|uniref:hypothetical protein n=1 Tax=Dyadobacter tibetensis TaxID=1211851 RepID=UPI00046EA50A|nr:hypothetical protein [Dyadobacter tibetensis]